MSAPVLRFPIEKVRPVDVDRRIEAELLILPVVRVEREPRSPEAA